MNRELQKLNLADDFLFAKVMSDSAICKKVLEKLLGITITKIEYPQGEKTINLSLLSKGIRLDIYVKDEEETLKKKHSYFYLYLRCIWKRKTHIYF